MHKKYIILACALAAAGTCLTGCAQYDVLDKVVQPGTEAETEEAADRADSAIGLFQTEPDETEAETESSVPPPKPITYSDYVESPDDSDIKTTFPKTAEVTDAAVMSEIRRRCQSMELYADVTKEIKKGDIVTISYKPAGETDGAGTEMTGAAGSEAFFEAGVGEELVGKRNGDSFTFDGYDVSITYAERLKNLTDETASELSYGAYPTVEKYKAYIKDVLEKDAYEEARAAFQSSLISEITQKSRIKSYPEELVAFEEAKTINSYRKMAKEQGITYAEYLKTYLNTTKKDFEKLLQADTRLSLRMQMATMAMTEKDGLALSKEEFGERLSTSSLLEGYGTAEEYIREVGEDTIRFRFAQEDLEKHFERLKA